MSEDTPKPAPQNKTIPNSLKLKFAGKRSFHGSVKQKNMATILHRLPFLHQLREAHNSLLKISPIWLKWCSLQAQNTNSTIAGGLSLKIADSSHLKSLSEGELIIACETPIVASLIKHQQSDLLKTFHDAGLDHIQRIKTHLSLQQSTSKRDQHNTLESGESSIAQANEQFASNAEIRKKSNLNAVKSIEATQSHIKNEQLAASLQRLAETLKNSS